MGAMASQITSLTFVYSTVYSGADQSKHQSSASPAFVWGPVNSPHKWPVTRKMFPSMMTSSYCALPFSITIQRTHSHLFPWKSRIRLRMPWLLMSTTRALKLKCHFDEIIITALTGNCHLESYAAHDANFIKMKKFPFHWGAGYQMFCNWPNPHKIFGPQHPEPPF